MCVNTFFLSVFFQSVSLHAVSNILLDPTNEISITQTSLIQFCLDFRNLPSISSIDIVVSVRRLFTETPISIGNKTPNSCGCQICKTEATLENAGVQYRQFDTP